MWGIFLYYQTTPTVWNINKTKGKFVFKISNCYSEVMFTYNIVIRGGLNSLCKELSGFGPGFFGCMVGGVTQSFEILTKVFKNQLHPLL